MTRLFACLAALVLAFPAHASGQTITAPQPPPRDAGPGTGTARIKGRVVADTGQPLRRVVIRVFSPELRDGRVAITDPDGRYELKDLPGGRYNLSAMKAGYMSVSYGQRRAFESGRPLQLGEGQTMEKVDFSLPRGGVVTGRILDEYGDPVSDVQVMVMRYAYAQGRRRLIPTGRGGSTNDIGEFRVYGLPPGQFYLSAVLRAFGMDEGAGGGHSGYAPTYYPGTADVAQAQQLTVELGQTVSDITMSLVTVHTARVSGSAVGADGRPLTRGFVSMVQRTGASLFGAANGAPLKPDGTFSVANVAPGEYTMQVNSGGGPIANTEYATARVTVAGQDVSGVQLVAVKPTVAHGRIVFADPATAKSLPAGAVHLGAQPIDPDNQMFGGGNSTVNDDFSFELRARPGTAVIRVGVSQPGWSLKAVRFGGVDVTDSGIEFRPNEALDGIEVELTDRPSMLSGTVTDSRGEAVKDFTVVVFARDRARWNDVSRYFGFGRPDQDGRYTIQALPPGEYYAVALDSIDQGEMRDPEFLDRLRDRATAFTLGESEARALDLKLQRQP